MMEGICGTVKTDEAMCGGEEEEYTEKGTFACKLKLVSTLLWLSPAPDCHSLS